MLKNALEKFNLQTYQPEYIIIVDNASTDGTAEFLNEWQGMPASYKKFVINHKNNLGASAGFYSGLEKAVTLDADWIWLSDDDAYPEIDTLKNAAEFIKNYDDVKNLSVLCSALYDYSDIPFKAHRRVNIEGKKIIEKWIMPEEYEKNLFNVDLFPYLGVFINREKLLQAGLTLKEYFIYYDDTEHSLRLGKIGKIICVPKIKCHHPNFFTRNDPEANLYKTYYGDRNRLDTYRRHFPSEYKIYLLRMVKNILKDYIKDIVRYVLKYKDYKFKITMHKLQRAAFFDALRGKFGMHEIYKPGWKPNIK